VDEGAYKLPCWVGEANGPWKILTKDVLIASFNFPETFLSVIVFGHCVVRENIHTPMEGIPLKPIDHNI